MPLDAAEFISELSITDPEGTDPLNQGDDQIRTVKRATQQSFPNIDAAVPQTAAQMAEMAIKNEANVFTLTNTFQASQTFQNGIIVSGSAIKGFDGSVAAPGYTFGNEQGMGMYRDVAGRLSFGTLGVLRFLINSTVTQSNQPIHAPSGSVSLPAFTFFTDPDTGIYRSAGDRMNFGTAGVRRAFVDVSQFQMNVPVTAIDGTAAAPGYAFANSTNMGMYRIANGILGFAPSGTEQLRMTSVFSQFAGVLHAPDGVVTAPGYAFTSDLGTGIYASATSLNIAANGVSIASFTSSSDIFAAAGRSWAGNSDRTEARPSFNFNSDSDTGFYNPSANTIGIAVAGASWGTMDGSALWFGNGISVHGDGIGSTLNPTYSFTNDTDSGMYRVQANILGWSCGNVEVMTLGTGGFGIRAGTPSFLNLPTSPGFGGSLWNDGGFVKVA